METRQVKVVTLLTCWNRPGRLRVSLPQIVRECESINSPLVVADDHSTHRETLKLIDGLSSLYKNSWLIRRDYERKPYSSAHDCTGLNNLFAFRWIFENFDDATFVLKVDDDIELVPGAFRTMIETWEQASRDGFDLIGITGLQTIFEEDAKIERRPGYWVQRRGCFAAMMISLDDWRQAFADAREGSVMSKGFDCYFVIDYVRPQRPNAVFVACDPGVVKHVAENGVHTGDADITLNYAGDIK